MQPSKSLASLSLAVRLSAVCLLDILCQGFCPFIASQASYGEQGVSSDNVPEKVTMQCAYSFLFFVCESNATAL